MSQKCTGAIGLKARVMGTTEPQPLTTQANFILKEVVKRNPDTLNASIANFALNEERELEAVVELAQQITDHHRDDFVLFNDALDCWIVEVADEMRSYNPDDAE